MKGVRKMGMGSERNEDQKRDCNCDFPDYVIIAVAKLFLSEIIIFYTNNNEQ